MHDDARETRSAAVVAAGILLSRLAGLVRQRVTAHFFGTGALADAITAAFRIGNITQNLLGEGSLSASFVPVYAKLRAEKRDAEAVGFAQSALGWLVVGVLLLSSLGALCAPWLSWLVAAGFDPERLETTVTLVRFVFPMTGLLVVGAWGLGVLNSHRRFFLSYAAPVLWNLVQIGVVLVVGGVLLWQGERLATVLTLAALAGAALQLGVLLAGARRLLGTLRPRLELANEHLREAVRRLPAVLLGRGVVQISGYVDTLLVSFLGTGANAIFGYAQMLYLLPMSVLGTGEAAVSLTEMSHDAVERDAARRNETLRHRLGSALARTTALSIPAMVALGLFGREIATLLLETGAFDRRSSIAVAEALTIFAPALLGNAAGRVFATSLYALGDTKRPARYAFARVLTSTGFALGLMGPFGVVGVVAGSTIAAWVEASLLAVAVRRTIGAMGLGSLRLGRLLLLALVCAALPLGLRAALPASFASGLGGAALLLTALGAVFALAAPWLGLFDLRALLRRRG